MLRKFENSFIADFNIILHDKKLLFYSLVPFLIIFFLRLVFPPLADFIYSHTGFNADVYYSLTALTFIFVIPLIIGMICSEIHLDPKDLQDPQVSEKVIRNNLYSRMIISSITAFILVLISIIIVKPVPTEGWLRSLFAAILISVQTPLVFVFIIKLSEGRNSGRILSGLCWIFLIAVPVGLLLHHPWNYFAFYSPFYWIAWAWVVPSPFESFIYGLIAMLMCSGGIIIFLRYSLQ